MLKLSCVGALVLYAAIIALASRYLPVWGTILVVVGLAGTTVWLGPKLVGRGIQKFATGLLETKSQVLRGAELDIHELAWTERPDDEVEDDEDELEVPSRYLLLECTIRPEKPTGPMAHYDPYEVQIVAFDKDVTFAHEMNDDEDDVGADEAHPETVKLCTGADDDEEDFDKVTGEQRLRYVFVVPVTMSARVKLRYYFESIGDFTMPEPPDATQALS